ncbi:hypothetical protein L7F22_000394 [Adiantum nelumboides]|nr:hypothetical protein [Adiantum nelumboides]
MTWNEQLQQKLNTFLEPMDSKINEEKKLLLGRPFSVYEVETVVKAMKKEKTPGPDGIHAKVLQELIKYAGQDLCDLLNHWRREGTIQPEFNQGLIKLIPKGQDKMEVKNYRPLTMLNTVYKVMAKALALRVRTVVSQVVHPKQFGLVQGRSIHETMLNVITAIDWAAEQEDEYVMINMDLEKAYDKVSWEYILAVIDRMGFGSLFLGMVKTLFQNASASIQGDIAFYSGESQLGRSQSGHYVADGVSHHLVAPDVTHAGELSSMPFGTAGAYHQCGEAVQNFWKAMKSQKRLHGSKQSWVSRAE